MQLNKEWDQAHREKFAKITARAAASTNPEEGSEDSPLKGLRAPIPVGPDGLAIGGDDSSDQEYWQQPPEKAEGWSWWEKDQKGYEDLIEETKTTKKKLVDIVRERQRVQQRKRDRTPRGLNVPERIL